MAGRLAKFFGFRKICLDSQHLLFVGDPRQPEFREVSAPFARSWLFREPAEALSRAAELSPTLMVLAQSRRGEFASTDVEGLRRAFPAAIRLNVLGSWCEGETRSGRPYPGWQRLLWYRWPETWCRLQAGERFLSPPEGTGAANPLVRPWTPAATGGRCRTIGLLGRSGSRLETLRQVLLPWGHAVELLERGERTGRGALSRVDSCVVAADSLDHWLRQVVGQVRRYRRLEQVVILLNFPRRDEMDWLQRQGGSRIRVLGQPFELAELQWALGGAGGAALTAARRTA